MTKVYVVGVAGKKMSGKSTFVDDYIKSHPEQSVFVHAFADPLKEACSTLFQFSYDQLTDPVLKETVDHRWDKSPRNLMQWLGTDIMRDQFRSDFWIYHWLLWFKSQKWTEGSIIFIPDVRFQNEINFIHNTLHGMVIYINRLFDYPNSVNMDKDTHSSENEQLNGIDIKFNNSCLDILDKFASNFNIIK